MTFTLNGETKIGYIVGDPIAQVKSPQNLTKIINDRGANALVAPAHIKAADLGAFIDSSKKMVNLAGIVITVPHKFSAAPHCDEVSARAEFIGSVNVITQNADGKWVGDNLDGIGYLDGVKAEGYDIVGKKALLVGTGGAGCAIAFELLERGVAHLSIFDMDETRLENFYQKLAAKFGDRVSKGTSDPTGYDFVANATPAGMKPEDPYPVQVDKLVATQFVADVITVPAVSPMIAAARETGCATMTGAGMFNAQAELLVDKLLDQ